MMLCVVSLFAAVGCADLESETATTVAESCAGCVATPPPGELMLPAASWSRVVGQAILAPTGVWSLGDNDVEEVQHDLMLPPGSTLQGLQFHFNGSSLHGTGQVRLKLLSRTWGGTTTSTPISWAVASSAGWTTEDLIVRLGVPYELAAGTAYWLSFSSDTHLDTQADPPVQFDGARITYTGGGGAIMPPSPAQ
jgi:hypothetical protein